MSTEHMLVSGTRTLLKRGLLTSMGESVSCAPVSNTPAPRGGLARVNGFSHDGGAGDDDNNSTDRHPTLGRREYDLHLQRLLALVCRHAPPPERGGQQRRARLQVERQQDSVTNLAHTTHRTPPPHCLPHPPLDQSKRSCKIPLPGQFEGWRKFASWLYIRR